MDKIYAEVKLVKDYSVQEMGSKKRALLGGAGEIHSAYFLSEEYFQKFLTEQGIPQNNILFMVKGKEALAHYLEHEETQRLFHQDPR